MIKRIAPYIALAGLGCTSQQPIAQTNLADDIARLVELVKADPQTERDRPLYGEPDPETEKLIEIENPNSPIEIYTRRIDLGGRRTRIEYTDKSPTDSVFVNHGTPDGYIGEGDILEISFDPGIIRDVHVDGFPPFSPSLPIKEQNRYTGEYSGGDFLIGTGSLTDFSYFSSRYENREAAEKLYRSVVKQAIEQLARKGK